MSEEVETTGKQGKSKGLIIGIIIAAIVLIAGGVAAYTFMVKQSPKAQYFLAEKAAFDEARDFFEERYKLEKEWIEFQQENAVGTNIDLNANYTDLSGYGFAEVEEIVNSTSLLLETETDMKKKESVVDIHANVMGMEMDPFSVALTEHDLFIELPFLDEVLGINEADLSELLQEIDPYTFDEDTEYSFGQFFEQEKLFTEEEQKYIEDEYGKYVFDELPDDAFTSDDEKVSVLGEEVKTEKITMTLDEAQIKDILNKVLTKMQGDEKLKGIIQDKLELTAGTTSTFYIEEMMSEFDEALEEIQEDLADATFKDGIVSSVWINDDKVVKRDFTFNAGEDSNEGTLTVTGDQKAAKDGVAFAYEFGFEDDFFDEKFQLDGDFTWKDDKGKDEVTLTVPLGFEDLKLVYEAEESLDGTKKDFERTLSVDSSFTNVALVWDGFGNYEKDRMDSENNISVDLSEFGYGMVDLNIDVEGEKIKSVELPDTSKVKDIGKMSEDEIDKYIDSVIAPKFEEWMMGYLMGMSTF